MTHFTANHFATHAAIRDRRPFSYWTQGKVTPYRPVTRKPLIVHTTPRGSMLGAHRS